MCCGGERWNRFGKILNVFFGRLKQRFRMLRTPNLLSDKRNIDNMMFSIIAVQNMVHDYVQAAEEMRSWSVQLKWQLCDAQNPVSISEFQETLRVAQMEDIEEEDDNRWFLPVVKKKQYKEGKWTTLPDEYYDNSCVDLTEIGLRGTLKPSDFGWDEHHISESEKEGFRMRQEMLVQHNVWFKKAHPNGFWLRS